MKFSDKKLTDKEYAKLVTTKRLNEMTKEERDSVWQRIYEECPDLFEALAHDDPSLIKND